MNTQNKCSSKTKTKRALTGKLLVRPQVPSLTTTFISGVVLPLRSAETDRETDQVKLHGLCYVEQDRLGHVSGNCMDSGFMR